MPEPEPPSDQRIPRYHSELFTVRVWREALNDHFEWRGQVLHSASGKVRYFRDWQVLIGMIQEMLPNDLSSAATSEAQSDE